MTGSGTAPAHDRVDVRVERLVPGGEGLAHQADGRVVFVRGGLSGESVRVELTQVTRDWARGVVTDVLDAAPERVVPPCPHRHEGCGGCDWQHLDPIAQLPAKVATTVEALRRTAKLDAADVRTGRSVPSWAYRTTVRVAGTADGRPGFRMEHSHELVPATGCLVAHPNLLPVLDAVRLPPGTEVTLRTSAASGEVTAAWDRRTGDVRHLPVEVRTGRGAAVVEDVCGHPLRVSAGAFFQSGPAAAELLVDAVVRAAPELATARHVADLYGGVGLFAVAAVPVDCHVTVVETARAAVADAEVNLAGRDADVVRGEVGAWSAGEARRPDVVIADPARSGLGRPGVAAVARSGTPVLALVSCDVTALARDAALLERHGYRHESTEVLDLFPNTHHVEAVTRFVRTGGARS
jgi:23S rRNA (uracil1939-C5)-methyltransferase